MRSPLGEQLVAAFEALKGLLVLLVGFGLLSVVNQNLAQVAEELVSHFHLNPASHYPRIFLELARRASDLRLWMLALFAFAYASLRMAEAYGLWRGRRWAEWLAVASGALYVPIEIYELFSGLSWIKAATLNPWIFYTWIPEGLFRTIMRIRDLILPEDKVFFILFKEMTQKIAEASTVLNEITHELPNGTEKAHRVRQIEHEADEITKKIFDKLNESLITPLEPEEIARLAPVFDDVLDKIDWVTHQICNYGIPVSNDVLKEYSYLILLSSKEITIAVENLSTLKNPDDVRTHCHGDQPAL